MSIHTRLAVRVFTGSGGLGEWARGARQEAVPTLVLAGERATRRGQLLQNIQDALDTLDPDLVRMQVEHPRVEQAEELERLVAAHGYGRIVAIGGGSILDLAKAALYLQLHGTFTERTGEQRARREVAVRIVAVPTTLSGAEANPGFGIVNTEGRKLVFWEERAAPRDIICHPQAFIGAPRGFIPASGMNALAHCLEGLYSLKRDPWCDPLAADAAARLVRWLPESREGAPSEATTGELQRASVEAGWVAFGSTPALHHAICHVLGTRLVIAHATANAIMLPHVIRTVPGKFWSDTLDPVTRSFREALPGVEGDIGDLVEAFVRTLFDRLPRLRDVAPPNASLPDLAREIATQPISRNHPTTVTPATVLTLLEEAW